VKQEIERFCRTITVKLSSDGVAYRSDKGIHGSDFAPGAAKVQPRSAKSTDVNFAHRRDIPEQERRQATQFSFSASRPLTIAVTGSMTADRGKVQRRIETLLRAYLYVDVVWYCGGRGTTDELVLEYLISKGKRPYVVGYQKYDLSPAVKRMGDRNELTFIDATVESVSKILDGPSE
jgi:hypothetical protein